MANRIPDERADRGGMTGATGNLTPDNADEAFVPAETRKLTDPAHRLDESPAPAAPLPRPADDATVLGGDERRDQDEEHL